MQGAARRGSNRLAVLSCNYVQRLLYSLQRGTSLYYELCEALRVPVRTCSCTFERVWSKPRLSVTHTPHDGFHA